MPSSRSTSRSQSLTQGLGMVAIDADQLRVGGRGHESGGRFRSARPQNASRGIARPSPSERYCRGRDSPDRTGPSQPSLEGGIARRLSCRRSWLQRPGSRLWPSMNSHSRNWADLESRSNSRGTYAKREEGDRGHRLEDVDLTSTMVFRMVRIRSERCSRHAIEVSGSSSLLAAVPRSRGSVA